MISIIIATYNSSGTIEKSLTSILGMNYDNWECIIIDGKSNDNTVSILQKYSEVDNRIKFISEVDNGIYDALNKGIKLAKGEWIYVLGSDDNVTPDGLLNLSRIDNIDNYDVIYGDIYAVDKNGSKKYIKAHNYKYLKYMMCASHQGMIVRKSTINKYNGFNTKYKIRADFDLMQRIYIGHGKFKYINTPVANFALTGFSNTNHSLKKDFERYRIMRNNKSTLFPLFFFSLLELKIIIKRIHTLIFCNHPKLAY